VAHQVLQETNMNGETHMIYGKKPWLASYDEGISDEIQIPDISLKQSFINTFNEFPDKAACHYLGETTTFRQLDELSGRFATALNKAGFGKGDVVGICMPNTPQYLITIAGAMRAGCAVSGLAPLLMPDEMEFQLNSCGASVLVILDLLAEPKLLPVADKVEKLQTVLMTGVFDPLASVNEYPTGQPIDGKTVESFYAFLESADNQPPEIELTASDTSFLQYTGGTTGPPKGAELTHGNMVSNIVQCKNWLHIENGKDTWISGFPMFHQAGLFIANFCLFTGSAQVLVPDPRNVAHIIQSFEQYKPTMVGNVPSLYMMLMAEPGFRELDFSSVNTWMSGAAPFPADPLHELESIVGKGKFVEVWGMTETCPMVTMNPAKNPKKIGSVGLPLPGTKLRIVNLEDGETEVALGLEGELICSGPQVMKGYLNKPEESAKALREHDGDIWIHTGDVGRMDEEGYVYIVDRAKDMLIVGGYKVFSSEVEDKLFKHPAIAMCAIIGLPNPDRPDSEIVKLVVQKSEAFQDKADEEVAEEIRAFAKEKLAPYKVPKVYEFIQEIPLTSVGKINKKVMRPTK
jgi:long-chain acyl-CoA synthetase